ncbi:MDR family MFS transporter [Methanobacterium aggregans]|uniref:MDR family MFS transporter n=1 Tax=Methanobacterium aggregans TaxID=1615586 RepID=UPI001AE22460|nr:MDR family MFS transporter [Methanobacterium aggregans]MBP2045471.1 EmrB/QacA subfamily drug resistance transporter [Methanobacterium aggregans]
MENEKSKGSEALNIKLLLGGLMISLLVGALDNSIMSTAMPKVIASLGGMAYYVWPFTIYLLTSTIAIILSGKLSDIYGRKKVLITGIVIFIVTSVLCGFSQNIMELTFFRGLQGIGGGILMTIPFIVVAEVFPPRERGKYMGILSSVFGFANVLGPVLGGFITDFMGWEWVFYVNIPVGITAIYMLRSYFPHLEIVIKEGVIDYAGIVTLTAALSALFLGLTFVRSTAVSSGLVASLFIFAGFMLLVFIYAEKKAREPILPMKLFKNSIFNVSSIAMFLSSAVMFCGIIYIPLFIQGVQGMSASTSGLLITPMLVSLTIASLITGQIISRTGTYKKLAVLAFVLLTLGIGLLSTMNTSTGFVVLIIYSTILGIGTGMMYPIFNVAVQNAVPMRELGTVTASMQFFRNIGATVALPVFGVIVNITVNMDIQTSKNVSPALMSLGIHNVFISGLVISFVGLLVCFLLKDKVLAGRGDFEVEKKDLAGE